MAPLSEAVSEVIGPCEARQLRRNLEQLALLTAERPYLEGEALSLADLAVVAQLSLLKFPASAGAPLAGLGVEGIADNPLLAGLFSWRDRILMEVG
jgi:glutathione S-transferase